MRPLFTVTDISASELADVFNRDVQLSLYLFCNEPVYEHERASINNIYHDIYDGSYLRASYPDEI